MRNVIFNNLQMKNILLVVNLIIFAYLNELVESRCGIDLLKKPKRVLIKQENENRRVLKDGEWEPIRIHLDFSYIENNLGKISKDDLVDLKEKIMPKMQEVFQKLLKVKRIQHKLKLNAPHCETFPIPEKYHESGEGVDADLVIFVLVDDTGFFLENRIEAAAIHCLQHYETRRPIAGYIQFKPELKVNNSTALDYMVWLAVHEVTHILVLNGGLYDDYIDANTLVPYGYDRIIGSKDLPSGKTMKMIKTKKVVEKAKKHFKCEQLKGVPLEYNGGPGTAGAHWSKKFMNTDYMIGDSYGENLISDITLGLFEDSGWYQVDYELANLFLWGKNKGCEFFDKKCVEKKNGKVETTFTDEFCTKLNNPVCSVSNVFRANCLAKRFKKELNSFERYFDDPKLGGIDPLTDRCPIAFEEKNGQNYYGGSCRVGTTDNIGQLEKVCPECACFMSNLDVADKSKRLRFQEIDNAGGNLNEKKARVLAPSSKELNDNSQLSNDDLSASCYQFKCQGPDLYVIIKEKSYRCPTNENIKINGFKGTIICPKNENLCHKSYKCKFGCTDKYENDIPFVSYRDVKDREESHTDENSSDRKEEGHKDVKNHE